MTTDIDQVPGWATGGTKTAPSAGLSVSGWTDGAQPTAPVENYLRDEERDKINELVDDVNEINDERGSGLQTGGTFGPIMSQYYGSSSADSYQVHDSSNTNNDSVDKIDLAVWADTSTGKRYLLALDPTDGTPQVHLYDSELKSTDGSPDSSSGDLSSDLPTGASQSWQATSFCVDEDGVNVYIIFQDTNLNPNETHQIQAWDIATWNVATGWPSTGTTLPGTGTCTISTYDSSVKYIGGDKVATANSWFGTVTASTDAAITIVNTADGTIAGSGAGDHPGSLPSANRLTSSGLNIYYTLKGSNQICSLQIASPSSGSATPDLPHTTTGNAGDIICTGNTVFFATVSTQQIGAIDVSSGLLGTSTTSSTLDWLYGGSLAFDGAALWSIGAVARGGTSRPCVHRFRGGQFIYDSTSTPGTQPAIEDILISSWGYDPTEAYDANDLLAPIMFDGRNLWFVFLSGSAYRLRRIPMAVHR